MVFEPGTTRPIGWVNLQSAVKKKRRKKKNNRKISFFSFPPHSEKENTYDECNGIYTCTSFLPPLKAHPALPPRQERRRHRPCFRSPHPHSLSSPSASRPEQGSAARAPPLCSPPRPCGGTDRLGSYSFGIYTAFALDPLGGCLLFF